MLIQILPRQFDDDYRDRKLALWLFIPILAPFQLFNYTAKAGEIPNFS